MTAYVFDPSVQLHTLDGHAEHAGRLDAIMDRLTPSGLLDKMRHIPTRPATEEELRRVHSEEHLAGLVRLAADGGGQLDADTYCTDATWDVAQRVCGSLIDLCRAVAAGEANNGLALLRPPAHHATQDDPMGFCPVNHVAVAVAALKADNPRIRVAIVDFDVHHGNGTADIFTLDPDVLYISSHQYPHFPGTGSIHDRGVGPGKGATVNLPLPAGVGDAGMLRAYDEIVLPVLDRFAPDFLLVSAGYDAHADDPLAGLTVSTAGFDYLGRLLIAAASRLCGGKVVFNLEGGYNLDALAACVMDTATALLDLEAPVRPGPGEPGPDLTDLLADFRRTHQLD